MADVISISALNKYVRSLLESDVVLTDIALRGEVSNFSRNFKTGHCYFSLKDEKASVKAVMFRGNADRLAFEPENGMLVVARGRITLYERDGAFQINVEFLFPDGVGAAQMAFEQLKERLGHEGLFAAEHKRALPPWPKRVGIVTSNTGAALQDVLKVAQRRCPLVCFVLAPVGVQGEAAAAGIAQAITELDENSKADVILVTRGGGSAEDLGVFNSEVIARAAYACGTPLVSAIGHEIDFTILDFVADLRAPTPSAAAEMILPDLSTVLENMMHTSANISNIIHRRIDSWYNGLKETTAHPALAMVRRRVAAGAEVLSRDAAQLARCKAERVSQAKARFAAAAALAASLNPYAVLARGYSVARSGNSVVSRVGQAKVGDALDIQLRDGNLGCRVDTIIQDGLADDR